MGRVEELWLPEALYIVVHYHPAHERTVPLFLPFEGVGFGMPVFSERELAEEFIASPNVDTPVGLKEISLENFITAGEDPIAVAEEHDTEGNYFYMIDPAPMHEWAHGVENMGLLIPMRQAAELLRGA